MTLYEKLKAAGCEIDCHQSDLYVKVTPQATEIIREHRREARQKYPLMPELPSTFRATPATGGGLWYDIPFAYDPFYSKKIAK